MPDPTTVMDQAVKASLEKGGEYPSFTLADEAWHRYDQDGRRCENSAPD